MTDEEKQAIEKLHNGKKMDLISIIRTFKREGIEKFVVTKKETVETVLNLIEKQQEELEKKDEEIRCWKSLHDEQLKIIDEMAKHIKTTAIYECPSKDCEDDGSITCEECIKEYFKKKVNSSEQN